MADDNTTRYSDRARDPMVPRPMSAHLERDYNTNYFLSGARPDLCDNRKVAI